jgi:hypothetical protein
MCQWCGEVSHGDNECQHLAALKDANWLSGLKADKVKAEEKAKPAEKDPGKRKEKPKSKPAKAAKPKTKSKRRSD